MDDFLDRLKPSALFIKLNSKEKYAGGVEMNSLIEVLAALNDSYHSYVEFNYLKNRQLSDVKTLKTEIRKVQEDSDLIVVDLKFESFGAAISPNTVTSSVDIKNFQLTDFKKTAFKDFKEEVIFADYNSDVFLKKIKKKYTAEQRRNIFAPIVEDIMSNPRIKLQVGSLKNPNQKRFHKLRNEKAYEILTPKPEKKQEVQGEKLIKTYLTVSDEEDLFGNKTIKRKNIRWFKEVDPDTYPFTTDKIEYDGEVLVLSKEIECEVEYSKEEEMYFIGYEALGIEVWGESRTEAEEAFRFTFIQLYKTYFLEKDKNLTHEAIELKAKLKQMITVDKK